MKGLDTSQRVVAESGGPGFGTKSCTSDFLRTVSKTILGILGLKFFSPYFFIFNFLILAIKTGFSFRFFYFRVL